MRGANFLSTSARVAAGTVQQKRALLAFQSRLLTWSANMTPRISAPSGMSTSKGYPFAWVVMGHTRASPTFLLYNAGDRIKAGRWPACSCPAWGVNVSHTISPRLGQYEL